jgi:hypothetical protein
MKRDAIGFSRETLQSIHFPCINYCKFKKIPWPVVFIVPVAMVLCQLCCQCQTQSAHHSHRCSTERQSQILLETPPQSHVVLQVYPNRFLRRRLFPVKNPWPQHHAPLSSTYQTFSRYPQLARPGQEVDDAMRLLRILPSTESRPGEVQVRRYPGQPASLCRCHAQGSYNSKCLATDIGAWQLESYS